MASLFTGSAVEAGLKLSRGAIIGLVFAGLFAAGGLGFWRGMIAIERMVEGGRTEGAALREAQWQVKLAVLNGEAKDEQARQAAAAAASSAAAERTIGDLQKALMEWEARHAARTGTDTSCLGPDDLRELNGLRRPRAGGP